MLYVSPAFTRDTIAPNFTSIKNNRCHKSLKEDFILSWTPKISWFTIVFKPIIIFPSPNNPFLNAIIPIELVVNINSKIFIWSHFLQVIVVIYKGIIRDLIGFNNHDLSLISINSYPYWRKNPWGFLVGFQDHGDSLREELWFWNFTELYVGCTRNIHIHMWVCLEKITYAWVVVGIEDYICMFQ